MSLATTVEWTYNTVLPAKLMRYDEGYLGISVQMVCLSVRVVVRCSRCAPSHRFSSTLVMNIADVCARRAGLCVLSLRCGAVVVNMRADGLPCLPWYWCGALAKALGTSLVQANVRGLR